MSSTGVRRERSTDSRLADSILSEERSQIESEKIFKETTLVGATTAPGLSNTPTGAGNSLAKTGDTKSGPFGNEFISVTIVDDAIDASITGPNYFPFLLLQGEGAADDDLDDIFPGTSPLQNRELTLQAGNDTITLKQNFGSNDNKILTPTGADIIMETGDLVFMIYSLAALAWIVTGQSDIVTGTKPNNLGDLNSGFVVNFNIFDDRQLYANQITGVPPPSNVPLTFINIPPNLSTNLKIYMLDVNTLNSLTVGGTVIYDSGSDPFSIKPLAVNDFLSIEFESNDQANINIISVKKNDDSGGVDVAPGIPGNIYAIGNTNSTVIVSWDQPEVGTLPITYDIAWSTSPAGDATNGPTTPAPGSPLTGITENLETVTGLLSATTYYFWVRGVNVVGSGDWAGPQQTNTEGTTNPGGVNFAIPGGSVLYNSITITWDQPSALLFTLFRTDPDGTVTTLQERSISAIDIVDTRNIQPITNYDYTLQTYNEFGTQLGTQIINVNSADIPTPVFVLSVVNGQALNFNVTFPADITLSEVEWALDSGFTTGLVQRDFSRPLGDWSVPGSFDFTTNQLFPPGTTFFGRVRLVNQSNTGPYAATQNVTTSIDPIPDELDDFGNLSIAGDANGLIRLEVNFGNSTSIGESAIITFRDSASVGGYFTYPGFELSRDNPPTDDLDPGDEDEIQVVRGGGGHGAVGTLTVVAGAVTAIAVTFGGKDYTSGEEIRIYDNNDGNYVNFTGTAIVNGFGQLTGVNITNGGDFYDNAASVLLVGFVDEAGTESAPWGIGNSLTGRAVARNETGSSDPVFDTMSVGS